MYKIINKKISCFCDSLNKQYELKFQYKKKPRLETNFNLDYKNYQRFYLKCKSCNHIFSQHNYDLNKIYTDLYIKSTYNNFKELHKKYLHIMSLPRKLSDNKNRVLRINNFVKKNNINKNKLLDIGAGIGVFGKSMKNKGWDVYAVETDKSLVEYLKKIGLNSILIKKSNELIIKKIKFDLIVFNKVLEHIEKPSLYLKYIKQFLKKNGLIYIEVPDVEAAKDGKLREEFYIEHHHIFSHKSLNKMLEQTGLKSLITESIIEPSGKYTLYSFCKLS